MHPFNAAAYGPQLGALISDHVPPLGPGIPNDVLRPRLAALNLESAFSGNSITKIDAALCCFSGLWLWHNFLDESHAISQEINTIDGSYWHAVMHRREPDYANAKYWFRRVSQHPIFEPLAKSPIFAGAGLTGPVAFLANPKTWDPFRFVDLCELIARGESEYEELARDVARIEWQLLFDYCYRKAIGATQ